MDYNDVSPDRKRLKLHVYGVGTFPVFSGIEPVTNVAECALKRTQLYLLGLTGFLMHQKGVFLIELKG